MELSLQFSHRHTLSIRETNTKVAAPSFHLISSRRINKQRNEVRVAVFEANKNEIEPTDFNILIFHHKSVRRLTRNVSDLKELDKTLRKKYSHDFFGFPRLALKRSILKPNIFIRKSLSEKIESFLLKVLNDVILANEPVVKEFLKCVKEDDISFLVNNSSEICNLNLKKAGNSSNVRDGQMSRRLSMVSNKSINRNLTSSSLCNFKLIKVIGIGSMAKVFLVMDLIDNKQKAMKCIPKSKALAQFSTHNIRTERQVLNSLKEINSPFLIDYITSFQTKTNIFFLFPYHSGGDLATHLSKTGQFSIDRTRFYCAQITLALKALHEKSIIYRDLKPENILLSEKGNIVLTDFGLSKILDEYSPTTNTVCGTAQYLAPEIIRNEEYSFTADFWCLGIVMYQMLTGKTPFYHANDSIMYQNILDCNMNFPEQFDSDAKEMIEGLLISYPKHRLGSMGAEELMEYDFFSDINWKLLMELKVTPPFIPSTYLGNNDMCNEKESAFPSGYFDESSLAFTPNISPAHSLLEETCSFSSFQERD